MIQLHRDYLLFETAQGQIIPCSAEFVAVELIGEAVGKLDPELVQQVIKHLIENGLKYSPEGSPLTITVEQKGEKIVIGVADSGSGIDEDERSRIFDKFFRGRRFRFETKGTGMGLAIAKGIMEAHGEKIWVESEPGQGSVFYISLAVSKEGGQ